MSIVVIIGNMSTYRLFKSTTRPRPTQKRSRQSTDTVSEFHAEAPQATASEGLAQCPYVAAIAGVEPTTIRTIGAHSTNKPPRATIYFTTTTYRTDLL